MVVVQRPHHRRLPARATGTMNEGARLHNSAPLRVSRTSSTILRSFKANQRLIVAGFMAIAGHPIRRLDHIPSRGTRKCEIIQVVWKAAGVMPGISLLLLSN